MENWKQNQGSSATYGRLIAAFESAGYRDCANLVKKLANSIEIPYDTCSFTDDKDYHQSQPSVPSPPEVESFRLTKMSNYNQEEEGKFYRLYTL